MYDRVRIDYTADVSPDAREDLLEIIERSAKLHGLFTYPHFDSQCGAWSIDITAHDRSIKRDLTDNQIIGYLESVAKEKGVTISALLRAAKDTLRATKDS